MPHRSHPSPSCQACRAQRGRRPRPRRSRGVVRPPPRAAARGARCAADPRPLHRASSRSLVLARAVATMSRLQLHRRGSQLLAEEQPQAGAPIAAAEQAAEPYYNSKALERLGGSARSERDRRHRSGANPSS